MALGHLRLQKSSETSVSSPTHSISLLDSALNDDFRVHDNVDINPNAIAKNLIKFLVSVNVLLFFRSSELAPKTFRAAMTVLCQCTSSNCKLRCRVLLFLFLLFCKNSVRSVETFLELKQTWPANVLRTCCLAVAQHRQNSAWSNI